MLVNAPAPDNPFEAAPDDASRALLAGALHSAAEVAAGESTLAGVRNALDTLHERYLDRRLRELRVQMSEAQRRGDEPMLLRLAQEKLRLDRERQR